MRRRAEEVIALWRGQKFCRGFSDSQPMPFCGGLCRSCGRHILQGNMQYALFHVFLWWFDFIHNAFDPLGRYLLLRHKPRALPWSDYFLALQAELT